KLKPDFVPALLNLANLHEDRGNRAAAEAAYRRALDAAPNEALALSRLAGVSHSPELDEAFDAASAANRASRAASGARYDRAAAERFIDRLIAGPAAGERPAIIAPR